MSTTRRASDAGVPLGEELRGRLPRVLSSIPERKPGRFRDPEGLRLLEIVLLVLLLAVLAPWMVSLTARSPLP